MKRMHIGVILVAITLVVVAGFVGLSGDSNGEELDDRADFAGDDDGVAAEDADDTAPVDDAVDEDAPAEESAPADDTAAEASAAPGDRAETATHQSAAVDRQLVHTGSVELLVDDVAAVSAEIRELTVEQGGFVSESSQEVHEAHNETWTTERLVIRVPSEDFDGSMQHIEELGEVQAFETDTEDVTDQLVDLEARLENLRAERDRLRTLFEDANETRAVLAVQDDLSAVQEEIERLGAQKQQLEDRVAYSTITVFLTEEEPEPEEPPTEPEWYETSVAGAFLDSVDGLLTAGRALVVGLAFAGPYLLVVGLFTALTGGIYRYRSRSGPKTEAGSPATDRRQHSDEKQAGAVTEDQTAGDRDHDDERTQSRNDRDGQ